MSGSGTVDRPRTSHRGPITGEDEPVLFAIGMELRREGEPSLHFIDFFVGKGVADAMSQAKEVHTEALILCGEKVPL